MNEELRKLALAATQGPWKVDKPRISLIRENQKAGKEACKMYTIVGPSYVSCYEDHGYTKADAAYIAAASPDVVLGILGELDAARAEVSHLQQDCQTEAATVEALRAEVERLKWIAEVKDKTIEMQQERLAEIEKPQVEPKQSEIFCGVEASDGLLTVAVMRRRPDDVAELLHSEQLKLPTGVKEIVVNADYREMWRQQVATNQQLCAKLSAPTPPAQRLTDEQIGNLMNRYMPPTTDRDYVFRMAVKATETAFAERNGINLGE